MTKEQYNLLGAKLAQSYKLKAKTSKSKGVGLIRTITGTEESDQGYLHLEDFYIRNNTITLENYLNATEAKLEALNNEIEAIKEVLVLTNNKHKNEVDILKNKINTLEERLNEFNLSIIE